MGKTCVLCGRGVERGHNVSHSHRKTKRKFHSNLQSKVVPIQGKPKRVLVCSRCLKNQLKTK